MPRTNQISTMIASTCQGDMPEPTKNSRIAVVTPVIASVRE